MFCLHRTTRLYYHNTIAPNLHSVNPIDSLINKSFPPPTEYYSGDLITGIDRSYERSIYRYHGMNEYQTKIGMECLALGGIKFTGKDKDQVEYFPARHAKKYRLATREELIEAGYYPKSVDFITSE